MDKFTKLVATIGPATDSEETLTQLIKAGMNVARFNTKHSNPEWHNERIQRVHKVSKELNQPIAVLLDLQGPEIRINLPREESFDVEAGETVTLASSEEGVGQKTMIVPKEVVDGVEVGSQVLLEDGACEFEIVEKKGDIAIAKAAMGCTVKHRKTMNTPRLVLPMPALTNRDYAYLSGVDMSVVDYVGLSFVRNASDIENLRKELNAKNSTASIIAKIENQAALDNLDEIIEAADAVMVARGDLGVEVPYQELIHWQRTIIAKCRQESKPVITATEMLKSMVEKPRPTRAEVSDVAHAIYDGTDAIMLSDETTIGKYPVKAVQTQASIASFNEPHALPDDVMLDLSSPTSSLIYSAVEMIRGTELPITKIVCLTETGLTAKILASYHVPVEIHVVTSTDSMVRKLQLLYGVEAHQMEMPEGFSIVPEKLILECKKRGIVQKGEMIIFIHGAVWKKPGLTNTMSIIRIA